MFGFGKAFTIILFIAIFFSLGLRNPLIGLQIVAYYAVIKIVWNIFRK